MKRMVDEEPKPQAAQDAPPEPGNGMEDAMQAEDAADAAPGPEEEAAAAEPDPLVEQAARIAALEAEAAELRDERLRALAEVENMRRRTERERREASRYGAAGLARDMLGVADNLRRALASGAEAGAEDLLKGVELVERELAQVFQRHHIARIEAEGARFDHNRHQAMFEQETADAEPGTVVQVVQDGYLLHDRLLRPAMVGVAKAPAAEAGEPE